MTELIAADEEPVVAIREGNGPVVIVCEHASNRLPRSLGMLGLPARDLSRHIAWDPGALELATGLADRLDGTLVVQRYSRLAIDCNRDPTLPDAVTERSEDTVIPGNVNLSEEDKARRRASIWAPFHDALTRVLDERRDASLSAVLVTLHSFTPVYRGVHRPWHAGIISTEERVFAEAMLAALRSEKHLVIGDNEPYSSRDNVDYTIKRHGRDRRLPHVMIEVRNDLVATPAGLLEWTERLMRGVRSFAVATNAV